MGITYYQRALLGLPPPQPFYASLLLFAYLLPLPLAAAWVGAYLATLPKQAKVRTIEGADSLPRWIVLLYGLGSAIYGLLSYGVNSVAAFAADLGAIAVVLFALVGPIVLGYGQGHNRPLRTKLGYVALSGWLGF